MYVESSKFGQPVKHWAVFHSSQPLESAAVHSSHPLAGPVVHSSFAFEERCCLAYFAGRHFCVTSPLIMSITSEMTLLASTPVVHPQRTNNPGKWDDLSVLPYLGRKRHESATFRATIDAWDVAGGHVLSNIATSSRHIPAFITSGHLFTISSLRPITRSKSHLTF